MELISLKGLSKGTKIELLGELGFNTDGNFVLNEKGDRVIDIYINQPVRLDNMIIFPGSTIILDDNPLSIAAYIEDYGDVT